MTAKETLLQHYQSVLAEFEIIDESNPIMQMFTAIAHVLGTVIEQVKRFLESAGLLIIKLVNWAKKIITEMKFPKKVRHAIRAIQDITSAFTIIVDIPNQFGQLPQKIIDGFRGALEFLGGASINLYQLAHSVLDATFFGDLVFKPIFSAISLPSFPGVPNISPSPLSIIDPFIQLIVSTVLAPFAGIKAILEPFRPIWNFVKALLGISPIKLIRALGRIPSILTKLFAFLRGILTAFTSGFPDGIFAIINPLFNTLLQPILSVSPGLTDLGIGNVISGLVDTVRNFFTRGPGGLADNIKILAQTSPAFGLLVPLYAFLRGSIVGIVDYLFGPILELIGITLGFVEDTNGVLAVQQGAIDMVEPFTEFSYTDLNLLKFNDEWLEHQAWMNEFGQYANGDRTDILFPERKYNWMLTEIENTDNSES